MAGPQDAGGSAFSRLCYYELKSPLVRVDPTEPSLWGPSSQERPLPGEPQPLQPTELTGVEARSPPPGGPQPLQPTEFMGTEARSPPPVGPQPWQPTELTGVEARQVAPLGHLTSNLSPCFDFPGKTRSPRAARSARGTGELPVT